MTERIIRFNDVHICTEVYPSMLQVYNFYIKAKVRSDF